jgi:ubiquinone/menaquinone biosynthesis C-methylase UbiE
MPDKKIKYKEKARESFNRQAIRYDFSHNGEHARTVYPYVLERLALFSYHSVLDVGCGTGEILSMIANRSQEKLTLAGIDLSSEMIRVAEKKVAGRADLRIGDAEELPWSDSSFDVVLCLDSFHHYPRPRKALSEMKRVIRVHGRLILGDFWKPRPVRQLMNLFIRFSKEGDVRVYSKSEIYDLLKSVGFASIQWKLVKKNAYVVTASTE